MKRIFRRGQQPPLESLPIQGPTYEGMDGTYDWAGLWKLDLSDMAWRRPKYSYRYIERFQQTLRSEYLATGPMVRPDPLSDVVHLNVPLAVFRSHPKAPDSLPPELEGKWTDTNPAWPDKSIDWQLKKIGLVAVWEEFSLDKTETYNLVPAMVGEVTPENSEPFDEAPLALTAFLVHVRRPLPH